MLYLLGLLHAEMLHQLVWTYARFTVKLLYGLMLVEMLHVVRARFNVEMLYQLGIVVWAYGRSTVEMLYVVCARFTVKCSTQLVWTHMLTFLWTCMGICSFFDTVV